MNNLVCGACKGENDRPTQRHCSTCHREYMVAWRGHKTAERQAVVEAVKRDRRIKRKYDLSPEEQESMLRAQGNACAICVTRFGNEPIQRPRVDRCHTTGHVRGLLCHKCNIAIGLLDDQPRFFDLAAQYLRSRSVAKLAPKHKMTMAKILERLEKRAEPSERVA
jgi:hypothetical protein